MTISSEIQNYLFHVQTVQNTDFPKNIVEIGKLTILLFITPITSFFSFNWLNDILYRVNTLPTEQFSLINQQFVGLEHSHHYKLGTHITVALFEVELSLILVL